MRRYSKYFFQLLLIVTIFFGGSRVFAASGVEITDISLHQKSDGVEVSNTTYSDSVLNTDPVLHNLNDYVTYKITIKNNDDVAHNILNVTDDNNSNYITTSYTHDNSIDANGTSEILMTVKLTKLVDDVSLLNNADVYSLGEINITLSLDDGTIVVNTNPKTGDTIIKYVSILLLSILTLVLVIMKKISKKSVMAIIISTLFIGTCVLASTTINLQVKISQDSIQVKVDTYNVVDGEGNEYKYIDNVDQVLGVSEPTMDGYDFVGFSTTENGTVEYQNGDTINRTDNLVLYPVYEPTTYHITYELNGGEATNPTTYNIEENLTISNPTKEHYDFAGWTGTDLNSATMNLTIVSGTTGDKSYTATWTPVTYTITYNLDGGETTNPTTYNVESGNMTLSEPTKDGYTFAGWTGTGLNEATKNVVLVSSEGGNREYTATWTATTYHITYDLDGGQATNPTTYNIEENLTITNPTKEHYDFAGWTGTDLSSATMNLTIVSGTTGDKSYTATWTPITYTITYNLNGGEANNPTTYNVESGNMTLSEPTKDGYTFAGWTGTGLNEATKNVVIVSSEGGNREYTAAWTATTYHITYDLDGGQATNPTTYNIEENLTITNPTKEHYDFAGWTGTDLSSATMNLTIVSGTTGDKSYTATWTPITYTITYNLNGGEANNPTTYNVESGNMTLSYPTKNGYTFVGWTGTGLDEVTKNVVLVSSEGGNREYTATWTPTTYTITYDLDGGIVTNANPESYNIETSTFTLWNPEREGYEFAGWIGTGLSTQTKNVTINPGSTGNRSYTATWTPVNYRIAYNLNGGEATNPTTYNIESEDITLNNPTKLGYEFTGWSGTGIDGKLINTTIPTGSTGNRIYSANWTPIDYEIDYEETYNSVFNPTTYTIESSDIPLMYPSRYGYRFTGWIGTDLNEPTMDVIINRGSVGDREYTATWALKEYLVTYIDGDITTNETITHGSEAPNKNVTGKTGYEFKFWSLTENGEAYDFSTPIITEITLFAVYKPINYTLTYNLDGGSMVTPNPATYNIESNDITLMKPTKAGHIFAGWTGTGLDGPTENVTIAAGSIGNRSYTATYYVDNHIVMFNDNGSVTNETVVDGEYATEIAPAGKTGYTFKHWSLNENGEAYNFNTPVNDNLILYAVYEIINYTITYNLDNGSVHTANPTSYNVESNSITLYNPTKTGHTFAGWIGTGLDSASMNVTINTGSIGDRSYTATYTINTYTVTYNDQGVLTTETVNYGANAPEKAAFGQEGYTFKHWSLSREGEAFDFSTGITGDITLFAVYEQN